MRKYILVYLLLVLACLLSCKVHRTVQNTEASELTIAFYNIENLFDTINEPNKEDDYFTPVGPTQWNSERYYKKLSNLNQVYRAMNKPDILGVAEIENILVAKDLSDSLGLPGIVHFDSPDQRGIDVALFYDNSKIELLQSEKIRIHFPDNISVDYTSRDVIYAQLKLPGSENLHVFVNHWPSRRGGLKESSPRREWVSYHVQKKIKQIWKKESDAQILLMGDFNDEPSNKSIQQLLSIHNQDERLVNQMEEFEKMDIGSYNYRGNQNVLDQFIVSSNLTDSIGAITIKSVEIFKKDFMIYKDSKYGEKPSRTYGGPNYYGGYSDHYPIRMIIQIGQ